MNYEALSIDKLDFDAEIMERPCTAVSGQVLHIIASSGVYGIERMLLALLPELRNKACDVALLCLNEVDTPGAHVGESLSRSGIPVFFAGLESSLNPKNILRLHSTIASCRPRIVHLHGYKATILAGVLSLIRRVPTVATFHTEATRGEVSRYVKIESHILRRLNGVAAVSRPIRDELKSRGVARDRVFLIPNGIPDARGRHGESVARAANLPEHNPLLFTAARLNEGKNIHLLIDVVCRLRKKYPGIGLLVAGDGPFRPQLEERVDRLGVRDAVRFLGFVDGVEEYLAASHCFVLPSRLEGMPISLLEAMSIGTPIVASAVGSIPFMVEHGREAILVRPGDVQHLAQAVEQLLEDPALQNAMVLRARERFVRDYTAEKMAERYVQFYRWAQQVKSNRGSAD